MTPAPAVVTPEPADGELMPLATCEEMKLWRAVLARLVLDAQAWQEQKFGYVITQAQALDAWEMIEGNTADYRQICDWAGIGPDALRDAFLREVLSGQRERSVEQSVEQKRKRPTVW